MSPLKTWLGLGLRALIRRGFSLVGRWSPESIVNEFAVMTRWPRYIAGGLCVCVVRTRGGVAQRDLEVLPIPIWDRFLLEHPGATESIIV